MDDSENSQPETGEPAEGTWRSRLRQRIFRYGPLGAPLVIILASSVYLAANNMLFPHPTPLPSNVPGTAVAEVRKIGGDTASVMGDIAREQAAVPTPEASDPRWAFLLLGYGGGSHEGAYLTDSMVLAVADPTKKTLGLLSIPRDSWVPQLFDGKTAVYNKLNTAYAFATDQSLYRNRLPRYAGKQGAGRLVMDTIARLVGLPITNYVALDFSGFRKMIDTVGGIDVQVPNSFTANYPANDDPTIDPGWITVRFVKGTEHMNGERAMRFARAREVIDNYSEGSDFARSRRQRLIMEAFKSRLFAADGLIHLPQLLAIAPGHVDSNYSIPNIGQLTQLLLEWKDLRIYQTALTQDNYLQVATGPGGAYVLVPEASDGSWSPIRALTRRFWDDPATAVDMAGTKIIVRNSSNVAGAATRLSEFLRNMGYRIGPPETGSASGETRLIDRTGGKAGLVVAQLAKDLGVTPRVVTEAAGSDELVLELGYDHPALAALRASIDPSAPTSAAGIEVMGSWSPAAPEPSEEQTPGQSSSPSASRSPSPSRPAGTAVAATATPWQYLATATSVAGSATPSATRTPSPSAAGGTSTATSTATAGTYTPSPSATPSPSPFATLSPSPSPSTTSSPTRTPTATSSPTATPTGAPTATRTPTPSGTPTPQPTATPTAS